MYDDYAQQEKAGLTAQHQANAIEYQPPTARRQLQQKKQILQAELARVDAALKALDQFPDLEQFTETIKAALR